MKRLSLLPLIAFGCLGATGPVPISIGIVRPLIWFVWDLTWGPAW